jgi:predicted NBD/HSP70 family sugar kinase
LGIAPPVITQLVRELIDDGLVVELENSPSQGGRPARLLGLVSSAGHAIGVKVAPDHASFVEVSLDGTVVRATDVPFDASAVMGVSQLTESLLQFVAESSVPLLGVGVGLPGTVDQQDGGIVDSTQLNWNQVPLGPVLRRALHLPVIIDNNVNALSIAERLFGQGRSYKDFLVVTIGTGIGAGIVSDGVVFRGHSGGAGDIGHMPFDQTGPVCQCGNRGCLEAFIGEAQLVNLAHEAGVLSPNVTEIAALVSLADSGDAAARTIFEHAGRRLGQAVAGVVNILDPEIVFLLGEGLGAWPHWARGFEPSLRSGLVPGKRGVPISAESWADDKWAQGAACLVLATPFDASGIAGDQGDLVRTRLRNNALSTR